MDTITSSIRHNWFWPLAVLLLAAAWAISRMSAVGDSAAFERALLLDVIVTVPLLFGLCYRQKLTRRALTMRIAALQCSGLWLAAKLIPRADQLILPHLEPLRWLGLAVVILFELWVMIAVIKAVFKPAARQTDLEALGLPPLLAKLALLEARFWRWVLRRPGQ